MDKLILTKSQENYLMAISSISKTKNYVRVKDVSAFLNIGPSSVSEGIKLLVEKKLIEHSPHNFILLTDKGHSTANNLEKRSEIIQNFLFTFLKFSPDESILHSKKIEHSIEGEVLNRLTSYFEFSQLCKCKNPKWMIKFQEFATQHKIPEKCAACLDCCKCES